MLEPSCWKNCLEHLRCNLSQKDFTTWILPLQAEWFGENLRLLAPNHFILDWVKKNYLEKIQSFIATDKDSDKPLHLQLEVGTSNNTALPSSDKTTHKKEPACNLNKDFTFSKFVAGNSNEFAYAASLQVAENPGTSYNPLFICGSVGLGKTHLMQAIGNQFIRKNSAGSLIYVHSERFLSDMIRALQHKTINNFKRYYRQADILLLDDVQFFSGKGKTQEEFFHTFNALIEKKQQIVLSCDRYPQEVEGIEERLKSRFSSGLTVSVDPPELETRIAILQLKASMQGITLPDDIALFIAKRFRSNVREIEGALNRVVAQSRFTHSELTLEQTKMALHDLLQVQNKRITISEIQKNTAEYFKIRVADLNSKSRRKSVTRPRQIAMALAKELTNTCLPEIGNHFGGRDHTTVLYACQRITALRQVEKDLDNDYINLRRLLNG